MHDGTAEEFWHACVLYINMCVSVRKEMQQCFWEACCLLQLPCAGMCSLRRKVWICAPSHSSVAPVLQLSFQAHRRSDGRLARCVVETKVLLHKLLF